MKKAIIIFSVFVCLGVISGCGASGNDNTNLDYLKYFSEMDNSHEIEIASMSEDNSMEIIDNGEDIEQFIKNLDVENWELTSMPDNIEQSATITFKQNETIKLGQNKDDLEAGEVGQLWTYKGSPYVKFKIANMSFDFQVSESTVEYLDTILR